MSTYLDSMRGFPTNKCFASHSTYIYFSEDTRASYVDLPVYVGSVPKEHIDTFDERLNASLRRIVDEGIDMDRMDMVIGRDERQVSFLDSATFHLAYIPVASQQTRVFSR